jgi:hypothetical protein
MSYSEEPPIILADRSSILDKAKLTLATKTVRWMSEREWRLIIPESGQADYDDTSCVTRIYLGARVSPEAEKKVRAVGAKFKIPVVKMKISRYKLSFSSTGG